jgi:FPC/CPF motif-containing protein YcgG
VKGNPFATEAALQNSALHWANQGGLTAADEFATSTSFLSEAHELFRETVLRPGFSCIGAKAAFNDEAYAFAAYDEFASAESTTGLCRDLCAFAHSRVVHENEYATFVAVFRGPCHLDEARFENLLWNQLRQLHKADQECFEWDQSVSANPNDSRFSFSFAGRAFYVIGLHDNSSRSARTFPWPCVVFNPHEQFERLRTDGKWKKMQNAIRAREVVLQGSVNPMLSDFGQKSEARQYSGRAVPDDWSPPAGSEGKCPFGHG